MADIVPKVTTVDVVKYVIAVQLSEDVNPDTTTVVLEASESMKVRLDRVDHAFGTINPDAMPGAAGPQGKSAYELAVLHEGFSGTVHQWLDLVGEEYMYTKLIDESADGTTIYIGETIPGNASSTATWRIREITFTEVSGDDVSVSWASGTNTFDKIWDDRASYSYS